MSLTPPPCVPMLIGCSRDSGSTSTVSTSSSSSAGYRSSSERQSYTSSSRSSRISSQSSFSSSFSSSSQDVAEYASTSTSSVQTSSDTPVDTSVIARTIGLNTNSSQGYKPYYMPRTGAENYLFASVTNDSATLVKKSQETSQVSILPYILVLCFSIVLMTAMLRRRIRNELA